MSASDAAPLPRLGEVFFDVRGESRSMRLSWYADTGVAVFSIWQGGTCTGTFRLPIADLPRMVEALQRGPRGWEREEAQQRPAPPDGYRPEPPGSRGPAAVDGGGHRGQETGLSQRTGGGRASEYPDWLPEGFPERTVAGLPDGPVPGFPDRGPEGFPDRTVAGLPDGPVPGFPDRGPEGFPERTVAGLPDGPVPGFPDRGPGGVPDRTVAGLPDGLVPGFPDRAGAVPAERPATAELPGGYAVREEADYPTGPAFGGYSQRPDSPVNELPKTGYEYPPVKAGYQGDSRARPYVTTPPGSEHRPRHGGWADDAERPPGYPEEPPPDSFPYGPASGRHQPGK